MPFSPTVSNFKDRHPVIEPPPIYNPSYNTISPRHTISSPSLSRHMPQPSPFHLRSAIFLHTLGSAHKLPISVNPFPSPGLSPITPRIRDSFSARRLRSTFASTERLGSGFFSGVRSRRKSRAEMRLGPGIRTTDVPPWRRRRMSGTSRCEKGKSGRTYGCLSPATALWLSLAVAQLGLMSLCLAIGVVAVRLSTGVKIVYTVWLVVSAVVTVLGIGFGLAVYAQTQRQPAQDGGADRCEDVEERAIGLGFRMRRTEGSIGMESNHKNHISGKMSQEENCKLEQHISSRATADGEAIVWKGKDDSDILMMQTPYSRRLNTPALHLDTNIAQRLTADDLDNAPSMRRTQEAVESNACRYLSHDDISSWATSSRLSTTLNGEVEGGVRDDVVEMGRIARPFSPDQEQVWLQMRREHFDARNRHHFLGLDYRVLDEMVPTRNNGENERLKR